MYFISSVKCFTLPAVQVTTCLQVFRTEIMPGFLRSIARTFRGGAGSEGPWAWKLVQRQSCWGFSASSLTMESDGSISARLSLHWRMPEGFLPRSKRKTFHSKGVLNSFRSADVVYMLCYRENISFFMFSKLIIEGKKTTWARFKFAKCQILETL